MIGTISFPVSGRVPSILRIAFRLIQDGVNRIVTQINDQIVFLGGPLGTPSSGDLTNATNLPITSVEGFGTGVEAFLITPSSANLATAVTGETGTGALVFGTAPALGSPVLTTPSVTGLLTGTASIRAHNATSVPSGGTAGAGFLLSSTTNLGLFFGSGAPSLSAAQGSLYIRTNGTTTNNRFYVNTNGGTTWTAVTTAA